MDEKTASTNEGFYSSQNTFLTTTLWSFSRWENRGTGRLNSYKIAGPRYEPCYLNQNLMIWYSQHNERNCMWKKGESIQNSSPALISTKTTESMLSSTTPDIYTAGRITGFRPRGDYGGYLFKLLQFEDEELRPQEIKCPWSYRQGQKGDLNPSLLIIKPRLFMP